MALPVSGVILLPTCTLWKTLAVYPAGHQNTIADSLSRNFHQDHRRELSNSLLQHLPNLGSPRRRPLCYPSQHKMSPFLLQRRILLGYVLIRPWPHTLQSAYLPLHLILKILLKLQQEGVRVILIVQSWLRQVWYSNLLHFSSMPLHLPIRRDPLS